MSVIGAAEPASFDTVGETIRSNHYETAERCGRSCNSRPCVHICLLPTNRVRILAERDRRARLKSSVSTVSGSLWNNCSGVDYRFSPRFAEFKISLRAPDTSGYDSTNLWVKDRCTYPPVNTSAYSLDVEGSHSVQDGANQPFLDETVTVRLSSVSWALSPEIGCAWTCWRTALVRNWR